MKGRLGGPRIRSVWVDENISRRALEFGVDECRVVLSAGEDVRFLLFLESLTRRESEANNGIIAERGDVTRCLKEEFAITLKI